MGGEGGKSLGIAKNYIYWSLGARIRQKWPNLGQNFAGLGRENESLAWILGHFCPVSAFCVVFTLHLRSPPPPPILGDIIFVVSNSVAFFCKFFFALFLHVLQVFALFLPDFCIFQLFGMISLHRFCMFCRFLFLHFCPIFAFFCNFCNFFAVFFCLCFAFLGGGRFFFLHFLRKKTMRALEFPECFL